jgi:hypothetical protein
VPGVHGRARGRRGKLTALLDARHGIQYEGEEPEQPTPESIVALQAWNMLATGMGSIDWHGLEIVVDLLGVPDAQLELLLHRLMVIKHYRKPTKEA